MNRAVACRAPQVSCRASLTGRGTFGALPFRPFLLTSVASGVLLIGLGSATAEDFTWVNTETDEKPWELVTNWSSDGLPADSVPTAGDTVNIAVGNAGIDSVVAIDTVNLNAGTLWINRDAVLNASTVNVNGGQFALSAQNVKKGQAQGIANISTLLNITSGTIDRYGLIDLGDSGAVTQSGGLVENPIQIHTPTYSQSGGTMNGIVTVSSYTLSAEGLVTGQVHGGGDGTMIQSGGRMGGWIEGMASYTQTGGRMDGNVATDKYYAQSGSVSGLVEYSQLFALSGDGTTVEWMDLVGARDAVMTQSDGLMAGYVFSEYFETGNSIGIATYSQSGGEMSGVVIADTYELSGGSVTGSVEFGDLFALSGNGHAVFNSELRGDGDAAVTQSDGTMAAWVSGIASYSQSGGTMNSTISVDKYTQSGGTIAGAVTTDTYELAGGTGVGFENVTIGSTLVQSGGVFDRDGVVVPIFTHSGGLFSGTINVQTYNLTGAGATSTGGTITASDKFNLEPENGTAILAALLTGNGGIVKSGASTVVLTNADNNFTGGVAIKAGTLEVVNDALTDDATVAIDPDAILKLTTTADTTYTGAMSGEQGDLVKAGAAAATLTGNVNLGELWINDGRLNVGNGTTTNEAAFDAATVAAGATLYIARNATLTIRKPKHLINNGILINDGTVHDDLDNTGIFNNNLNYNANVATNTGTINNNTPGLWTGNVRTNAEVINNNAGATWVGAIESNGDRITNGGTWDGGIQSNNGNIVNNGNWTNGTVAANALGANIGNKGSWTGVIQTNAGWISTEEGGTWTGNVIGNSGRIANAGGTWVSNIVANTGHVINDNRSDEIGTGYWVGNVESNHNWIFNGGGGDWKGDVITNNNFVMNGKLGTWTGDVRSNSSLIWNGGIWNDNLAGVGAGSIHGNAGTIHNAGGTWTGDVQANTGAINNIVGSYLNLPTEHSTWIGDVLTNGGTILNGAGSTWTGDVLANTGTINNSGVWTGAFTSAGTVNAQNQIVGAFTNSGLLHLTGSLAGVTTLSNSGIIDMQGAGATQTLTVASAAFDGTSTLKIDVDVAGHSDKIVVTGAAALDGTVYVSGAQASGMADYTAPYEFLTAASTTGTFAGVTTDLAFLNPTLTYDTDSAFVTLARNAQSFVATGDTPNQKEVAATVDALGAGNAIYDAVLFLNQDQAQDAFDQLSGEAHASLETASIESADLVGAMATGRIAQAFAKVDSEGSASGFAGDAAVAEASVGDSGFWTQFYGAVGIVATGSSSAGVNSMTGGAAMGLDGVLGDWRLGMMLHAGITGTSVASLNSTSNSTNYGVGVYGGRQWGDTTLSLGVVYTRHDIRAKRDVAFPGFTDTLSGAYASGTTQVFGEVSHEFDLGAISVTPYAGISYVSHATDGFTETGGAASLTSSASVVDATFTTLGVSADRKFVVGDDMLLTATASLGWRHAFADAPGSTHTLAGGTSFSTVGTPVVADMLMFGAGLNLDMSAYNTLTLVYDGQAGGNSQSHALTGTWSTSF